MRNNISEVFLQDIGTKSQVKSKYVLNIFLSKPRQDVFDWNLIVAIG